jgi:oligopeptidase B
MHGSVGRKDHRPPLAARRQEVSIHHGVELRDDYAWLRAANWQDVMRDPSLLDAEIRAYLEAENAYCEAELADTRLLQETLFSEMKARLKQDDSTVPTPDGAFDYYSTFISGGQYPGDDTAEERNQNEQNQNHRNTMKAAAKIAPTAIPTA